MQWRRVRKPGGERGVLETADGAVAVYYVLDEAHAEGVITHGLTDAFVNRAALLRRPDDSFAAVLVVRRDGWFLVTGPFKARYQPIEDTLPPPPKRPLPRRSPDAFVPRDKAGDEGTRESTSRHSQPTGADQ